MAKEKDFCAVIVENVYMKYFDYLQGRAFQGNVYALKKAGKNKMDYVALFTNKKRAIRFYERVEEDLFDATYYEDCSLVF